jgi:hypothetical protein
MPPTATAIVAVDVNNGPYPDNQTFILLFDVIANGLATIDEATIDDLVGRLCNRSINYYCSINAPER